jgi:hypothetical protein
MADYNAPTIFDLVEVVWKKMSLVYGRDFLSRWEGLDLDEVKADWAHELGGFEKNPMAIHYGLMNLPISKPLNVYEFREICRRAPGPRPAALLDQPRANPEIVRRSLEQARAALTKARG